MEMRPSKTECASDDKISFFDDWLRPGQFHDAGSITSGITLTDLLGHFDAISNEGAGQFSDFIALCAGLQMGNVPSVTQTALASPTLAIEHSGIGLGELQRLVDAIDEIGLSLGDPILHRLLMIKITTDIGIIPTRSRLRGITCNSHPEIMTLRSNLFKGVFDGKAVALKKPRHQSRADGPGAIPADLIQEYFTVAMFKNQHVTPVLGIFVDSLDSLPAVVFPYMSNGTIKTYLEDNPNVDELRLLTEVADGITYLHNLPTPVIHGDIRSANIMINAEGKAVVIDFGSSFVLESGMNYAPLHDSCLGNARWMAPEAFGSGMYPITLKADVWAFANLCIEVFSGKRPFDEIIRDPAVMIEIVVKNKRPSRPRDIPSARQLNDSVWVLMEQSWNLNPSHRPTMSDIYSLFSSLVTLA